MNKVIEQFQKRASTYSASANWISDRKLLQAHVDACCSSRGHVLELCCGTGMVGRSLQAAGMHVCGIDLTPGMAAEANAYFPCICAPADQVPFLDSAFDDVVLRQAYFLLPDGQKVLAEARRVLKPSGCFVLSQTVPFSAEDTPWLEKIHRTKQAALRFFHTEETLAQELDRAGFRIETTQRLTVRENINRWMAEAPELAEEIRAAVIRLVAEAPEPYRGMHQVEVKNNEVFENWNWVVFTARKKAA